MEFDFNINKFFPDTITILHGRDLMRLGKDLWGLIDTLGEASRIAQNLRKPVTVSSTFADSNQTLYVMADLSANNGRGAVLGMLKIGPKRLFLLDKKGSQNERNPTCVLDFYIHESCQRMGLGKILFGHFLESEKLQVRKIAIDRPSDKFLGFLRKHYGLVNFIPQVNNFVIYDGFFDHEETLSKPHPVYQQSPTLLTKERWNSMISVNTASDESSVFRARGNQSTISCLSSESPHNGPAGNNVGNELWRTNSFASDGSGSNRTTTPVQVLPPVAVHHAEPAGPPPISSEAVRKFSHHRLW